MTIDHLLAKWLGKEKAGERAEYQQFLTELMQALGVDTPGDGGVPVADFQFEAPVRSAAVYGGTGTKRIDLYKRGHFILEAKQSQPGADAAPSREAEVAETLYDLFGTPVGTAPVKSRSKRRYDRLMEDARVQAQRYALALPEDHPTPPFLLVADIGYAFELYFDWAGNGRGYRPFPDERGYRIALADLASDAIIAGVEATAADTLRAIWSDPPSIDPRTRAARVTRDIAERLSRVAAQLEKDQRDLRPGDAEIALGIEATSLFLMRTLFCMFAEDVGLLPADSFKTFLSDAEGRSDQFWRRGLEDLWGRMNDPQQVNRYWAQGDAVVRYFNGNLFAGARVYDLPPEFKRELRIAADQDWRAVEPAIFGTLLEQVLTPAERAKLGAHYTPRPYVERLVQATIMDVLTPEWEAVRDWARALLAPLPDGEGDQPKAGGGARRSEELHTTCPSTPAFGGGSPPRSGEEQEAIALATTFHARLVAIRILDPACGTGNFLYVAMEALLRLESEVRQFVVALGGTLEPAVHPNQFLGLELNPRAAVIAELVLWIGWLRFRLANTPDVIGGKDGGEPVLPPLTNINGGTHGGFDAVLVRDRTGEPDTADPRRPEWPPADFIVGNPPFIGGKDLRDRLGGGYAEALWAANPRVPKSADFVMHWWDRAADILTRPGTRLRRFGLVTTNSITQVFSRRVIEGWLHSPSPLVGEGRGPLAQASGKDEGDVAADAPATPPHPSAPPALPPSPTRGEGQGDKLHLVLAIPDHPWTRVTRDAAAVRIAMTVAEAGPGEGEVIEIVREAKLDTDEPELEGVRTLGDINDKLALGPSTSSIDRLAANQPFRVRGVEFHGSGYVLDRSVVNEWRVEAPEFYERYVKSYVSLGDYKVRRQDRFVADLYGVSEKELRQTAPKLYQHLLKTAYPLRKDNEVPFRRNNWWMLALPHTELRSGLAKVSSIILTPITAKYRWFVRDTASLVPDQSLLAIFLPDWADLGILSSQIHEEWFVENCGWLGVGNDPRYNPTRVFDTFPFPIRKGDDWSKIGELAEELDSTRRTALAENPSLTMTGLYNLVAPIRDGTLPPEQEAAATKARAFIVAKLHDDLDQAVAYAYGWGDDWRRAPLTPAEIVRRLVALNAERAAEEKAGHVRWLRPDYQRPRFGG